MENKGITRDEFARWMEESFKKPIRMREPISPRPELYCQKSNWEGKKRCDSQCDSCIKWVNSLVVK